jgi:hypothetical protein
VGEYITFLEVEAFYAMTFKWVVGWYNGIRQCQGDLKRKKMIKEKNG